MASKTDKSGESLTEQMREAKNLSEITLDDAKEIIACCEYYRYKPERFQIRYKKSIQDGHQLAQVYVRVRDSNREADIQDEIVANFDDGTHSPVRVYGNEYFRCHAKAIACLLRLGYKLPYEGFSACTEVAQRYLLARLKFYRDHCEEKSNGYNSPYFNAAYTEMQTLLEIEIEQLESRLQSLKQETK
jgi:hypothetical protein